jgi:hypothetical protein
MFKPLDAADSPRGFYYPFTILATGIKNDFHGEDDSF